MQSQSTIRVESIEVFCTAEKTDLFYNLLQFTTSKFIVWITKEVPIFEYNCNTSVVSIVPVGTTRPGIECAVLDIYNLSSFRYRRTWDVLVVLRVGLGLGFPF